MKNTFIKLIAFGIIIYLLQLCISKVFVYPQPWALPLINSYKQAKDDIIYFGDSSVGWTSKYDTNLHSVAGMLGIILEKNHSVGEVTHKSYHAGMFDEYSAYMTNIHYYPRYIIVPINMRSFSPEWYLRPQYQFVDELLYLHLHGTLLSPVLSFLINVTIPDVNRIFDTMYSLSPVYDGDKYIGNGASMTIKMSDKSPVQTRIPAMIQMAYFGPIQKSRRLENFLAIADRYKNSPTKVIFYITPMDYQTGEKYFGKHYDSLTAHYISQISQSLRQHGAIVLDLSRLQEANNFIWKEDGYINEHLNQFGRHKVAEQVGMVIEPNLTLEELTATQSSKIIVNKQSHF